MNLFLGTFDRVLRAMHDTLPVAAVVSERHSLQNMRLQDSLREAGSAWFEIYSRQEFEAVLQQHQQAIDLCVVAGFSHILPQHFIDRCNTIINFHPGIVQLCRGPHPVGNAILRGHSRFGVTVHLIDSEAIDAGPILRQRYLDIDYSRTYGSNYRTLLEAVAEVADELLPLYGTSEWPRGDTWQSQKEAYQPRLTKAQNQELAGAVNLSAYRPLETTPTGADTVPVP